MDWWKGNCQTVRERNRFLINRSSFLSSNLMRSRAECILHRRAHCEHTMRLPIWCRWWQRWRRQRQHRLYATIKWSAIVSLPRTNRNHPLVTKRIAFGGDIIYFYSRDLSSTPLSLKFRLKKPISLLCFFMTWFMSRQAKLSSRRRRNIRPNELTRFDVQLVVSYARL